MKAVLQPKPPLAIRCICVCFTIKLCHFYSLSENAVFAKEEAGKALGDAMSSMTELCDLRQVTLMIMKYVQNNIPC